MTGCRASAGRAGSDGGDIATCGWFVGCVSIAASGTDEKIIAVPSPRMTQRYVNIHDYMDVPEITLKQIEHFFEHYKELEPGKWVKIGGWHDEDFASTLIIQAIKRAKAT